MTMSNLTPALAPLALPENVEQHLFADEDRMAKALAGAVADALRAGLAARGTASLAVSGGRSPIPFLRALAEMPLDWARVYVTLVDERWVAPGSPDSNEGLVRQHLLREAARSACLVPLKSEAPSLERGVVDARGRTAALPPRFDAVVLGMGEDGHTASLFPGAAGLAEALDPAGEARLAGIVPPLAPHPRITWTLAALLETRHLLLQAGGASKRAVLEAAAVADPLAMPIAAFLRQRRVPLALYFCA